MARLNDFSHGRKDATMLDPRDIVIDKSFNYRDVRSEESRAHIAWLKKSIRENGVQEPIRVRFEEGTITLVNGECRLLACLSLRAEGHEIYIPAISTKGDVSASHQTAALTGAARAWQQLRGGK